MRNCAYIETHDVMFLPKRPTFDPVRGGLPPWWGKPFRDRYRKKPKPSPDERHEQLVQDLMEEYPGLTREETEEVLKSFM